MRTTTIIGTFLLLTACGAARAADPITTAFQKGLFEEEANQNLDAAIKAYKEVISRLDEQRKLGATAVFRLGECYRKLGKTNDAVVQYQRLLHDFADQPTLVTLSRQNLTGLGMSISSGDNAAKLTPARSEANRLLIERLKVELEAAQEDLAQKEDLLKLTLIPPIVVPEVRARVLDLRRQIILAEDSTAVAQSAPFSTAESISVTTDEEETEIRRIQALIRDSPDLINARNVQVATTGAGDNAQPRYGTLLHKAAQQGQLQVAAFLLNSNAEINAEDQRGSTPLHWAAGNGHKAMVELLLSRKANPNARDSERYFSGRYEGASTPLHLAVEKGYRSVCEALLGNGADPNLANNVQQTPLHEAAGRGDEAIVRLLLDKGADVKAKTRDGETALHRTSSTNVTTWLLQRGADVNAQSKTGDAPLHGAANRNQRARVELLLAHKADPNIKTQAGQTPLHRAAMNGSTDVIAPLIARGADPNARDNDGAVPLDLAITDKSTPRRPAASGSFTEALTALLKNGANPNPPGDRVWTPLYRAVASGQEEMVEILLKHGANPNVHIDKDGNATPGITPLLRAAAGNFPGIVKLLLESKADPNLKNDGGEVPLHVAISHDKREVVDLLLAAKADPNALDDHGLTPLDYLKHDVRSPMGPMGAVQVPRPPNKFIIGGPRQLNPSQTDLAEKLRRAGAVDWAPRPNQITVIRRGTGANRSLFQRDTNGWNRHTLFEVLANTGFCMQCSDLWFPDFANVRITRRDPTTKEIRDFTVDVQAKIESADCKEDIWLEWGDLVDIPEREHKLNEKWMGLPEDFAKSLAKCLERSVTMIVKGQRHPLVLAAKVTSVQMQGPTFDGPQADWQVRLPALRLREAVLNSGLVLTSSDLTRVAFSRIDPASKQVRTAVFDLKEKDGPGSQLWLRDGDIMEVPEKEGENTDAK